MRQCGTAQHLGCPEKLSRRAASCLPIAALFPSISSIRSTSPGLLVDDEAGTQRIDQCRLGHGIVAEHQGAHARAREVHGSRNTSLLRRQRVAAASPHVACFAKIAIEEGDEGFRLGSGNQGQVVAPGELRAQSASAPTSSELPARPRR